MILRLYQKEMDKMEDIEDEDEDGIGGRVGFFIFNEYISPDYFIKRKNYI